MEDAWIKFAKNDQLIMIANECSRAANVLEHKDVEGARKAIERGLDLIDRTVDDGRWQGQYGELLKFREALAAQYLCPVSSSLRILIDWLARYIERPKHVSFVRG